MLKIEQLQLLITLSKTGSIHKAADNLFVSQPALSSSLKKLEKELGVTLFDRTSKGLVSTKIGKELTILAEKTIQDVNEIYHKATSFKWETITLPMESNVYLHTENFFFDYYLSDFFTFIQEQKTEFQTQVLTEPGNLKNIDENLPGSHIYIYLEEKNHPLSIPSGFCKYKVVDVDYAIKAGNACPLYDKSTIDEAELLLYPYAHIKTDTKFFINFYDYLTTLGEPASIYSSDSPMKISNYIVNHAAWTIGILFDKQIPKKEFFSSALHSKTIRLQTNIPNEYQIILAAHQNTQEEIVNLLLQMIRNELILHTQSGS